MKDSQKISSKGELTDFIQLHGASIFIDDHINEAENNTIVDYPEVLILNKYEDYAALTLIS